MKKKKKLKQNHQTNHQTNHSAHHKLIFRRGHYKVFECVAEDHIYYTVVNSLSYIGNIHRHYTTKEIAISVAVNAAKNYVSPTLNKYLADDILYLITGIKKDKEEKHG